MLKEKRTKLRKYQLDALRWSDNVRHPGFYLDMRLRKCLLTIRRIKRWHCAGPFLIVCPDSAIDGWTYWLELEGIDTWTELTGSAKERASLLFPFPAIHTWFITNKECHRSTPEIKNIPWDVVVFDESRFMANPQSDMSKFYVNNFRDVNHRIILTGTPDYKNNLDYYQQLRFLDHRSLPYKDYWHFRMAAFFLVGYDHVMKKKHHDILKNTLAKYCYFVKREDVSGGRTQEYVKYTLKMPRKLRKRYTVVEEEFVLEQEHDMKTIFATQSHIWLMRMCGGFIDDTMVWDGKLKKLVDLMKHDLKNESVVVLCRFKREVYYIQNYLDQLKLKSDVYTGDIKKKVRREIIKAFSIGNFNYLIAHPAAISHGTDLAVATVVIFYSQPNGQELRDQSEKRIFTMADEKHMLIIDLIARETVDDDTREGHLEDESRRDIFSRMVKRCQKNLQTV